MFSPHNVFAGNNIITKTDSRGNDTSGVCISTGPKKAKVKVANGQIWTIPYALILAVDNSKISDQPQVPTARVGQKVEDNRGEIFMVDKVNPTRYNVTSYNDNKRYGLPKALVVRVFD